MYSSWQLQYRLSTPPPGWCNTCSCTYTYCNSTNVTVPCGEISLTAMHVHIHATINIPSTLFSSGVMVAHFIPTWYILIASAHSTVTAGTRVRVCSRNTSQVAQNRTVLITMRWLLGIVQGLNSMVFLRRVLLWFFWVWVIIFICKSDFYPCDAMWCHVMPCDTAACTCNGWKTSTEYSMHNHSKWTAVLAVNLKSQILQVIAVWIISPQAEINNNSEHW